MVALAPRVARGYAGLSVGSGDVFAFPQATISPRIHGGLALRQACAGASVVPVNRAEEPRYIVENPGAKVPVIHANLWRSSGHAVQALVAVTVAETPQAIRDPHRIFPTRHASAEGAGKIFKRKMEGPVSI